MDKWLEEYNKQRPHRGFTETWENYWSNALMITLKMYHWKINHTVNDTAPNYGDFIEDPVLGRLDNWRNILSNKLTALMRYEPKDVVDIILLADKYPVDWKNVIQEAQTKDPAVEPVELATIIRTMPLEKIQEINFINQPDLDQINHLLAKVSDDILYNC